MSILEELEREQLPTYVTNGSADTPAQPQTGDLSSVAAVSASSDPTNALFEDNEMLSPAPQEPRDLWDPANLPPGWEFR